MPSTKKMSLKSLKPSKARINRPDERASRFCKNCWQLLDRLSVSEHAVTITGQLRALEIAIAPLCRFGVARLNGFRPVHGRVCISISLRFGLRGRVLIFGHCNARDNGNRGRHQKALKVS